jgi:hypothetical protein
MGDRGSSYPGTAEPAPSSYYGQTPSYNSNLDRPIDATSQPQPSGRDLTANPYDTDRGMQVADRRNDGGYESPQATSDYGETASQPARSADPWRPGSTGDYPGSTSGVGADRYQASLPDRETPAAPASYSSDYGSYTR